MAPCSPHLHLVAEVIASASRRVLDNMARFSWAPALLALSSLVSAQSTTSQPADGLSASAGTPTASYATATVNGTASAFSVAFTVPASSDVGPNVLPNIKDPNAKQAQALCPGYTGRTPTL